MKRLLGSVFHIDHILVVVMTFLIMKVILIAAFKLSFLNPVARTLDNFQMTDIFYDITNSDEKRDTSDVITLVDMTNVYKRGEIAQIIDDIQDCEPNVLGVDIVFDGLREDSMGNERLIESVCSTTVPTIWAYKLTSWDSDEGQFMETFHSFFKEYVDFEEGYTNVQRDVNGGTVRSFGIQRKAKGNLEYSLPAKVAIQFTNDSTFMRGKDDCTINYSSTEFPVVPYDKIKENAELIQGHIVLLGAMDDKRDLHFTPIGQIPGLSILAYAVQTMINRKVAVEFSEWMTLLISFLFIWLGQLMQHGFSRFMSSRKTGALKYIGDNGLASSIMAFLWIVSLIGLSFWLFERYNIYLNVVWAIMGVALLDNARELYALIIHVLMERFECMKKSLYAEGPV